MTDVKDWRRRLLEQGDDPDPRFTLANERTFLAWIRTSLALTAGGIALEAFSGDALPGGVRKVIAVGLLLLGALLGVMSWLRWYSAEKAMRKGTSLPLPLIAPLLAAGVGVAGLVLIVTILVPR